MELHYQETKADFVRWHRLNKTGVVSQWRSYLLVAVALAPAAIVLAGLGSIYATLWVGLAMVVMLTLAGYRYAVPLVRFPGGQRVDVFERHMATRKVSRSITQWKWERIEEFRETSREFQFWRLGVSSHVPKRAVSAEQQQALRQLLAEVHQNPAGDSPPLPLFQQRILAAGDRPVYRYQMKSEDAHQIMGSKLKPYQSTASLPKRPSSWVAGLQYAFLFCVFLFGSFSIYRAMAVQPMIGQAVRDLLICLIPFVVLLILSRVRSRFRVVKLFKLPPDEISVRLCHDGIVMGAADYVGLAHWSDITAFYTNDHYLGLRTIHSLIHMLPKRAIGDEADVVRFLETAAELKTVADRDSVAIVSREPVQSDNPYQTPLS